MDSRINVVLKDDNVYESDHEDEIVEKMDNACTLPADIPAPDVNTVNVSLHSPGSGNGRVPTADNGTFSALISGIANPTGAAPGIGHVSSPTQPICAGNAPSPAPAVVRPPVSLFRFGFGQQPPLPLPVIGQNALNLVACINRFEHEYITLRRSMGQDADPEILKQFDSHRQDAVFLEHITRTAPHTDSDFLRRNLRTIAINADGLYDKDTMDPNANLNNGEYAIEFEIANDSDEDETDLRQNANNNVPPNDSGSDDDDRHLRIGPDGRPQLTHNQVQKTARDLVKCIDQYQHEYIESRLAVGSRGNPEILLEFDDLRDRALNIENLSVRNPLEETFQMTVV
ncbi:unnamed protein product [Caenorhabditis bovis]|uniref:Uncharacterized protein n=1 Tax=Caenorhabditis bovis TaxID=2654633 RepID=A0A8S1F6S1_9PELO|nr:unnamed protein product [Caenorhabditis bovis]